MAHATLTIHLALEIDASGRITPAIPAAGIMTAGVEDIEIDRICAPNDTGMCFTLWANSEARDWLTERIIAAHTDEITDAILDNR